MLCVRVKLCYRITTRSSEADHSLAEARHADRSRRAEATNEAANEDADQVASPNVEHHAMLGPETMNSK